MKDIEITALLNKREGEVAKLKKAILEQRDLDEGVVVQPIKKIQRIEEQLRDRKVHFQEINIENIIHPKKESSFDNNETQKNMNKNSSESKPKKTLNKDRISYGKIGVNIEIDLKKKIEKISQRDNVTANDVVVASLKELFNETTQSFNMKFNKKSETKITSYNLPENMLKAIDKIAKKYGLKKNDVFIKLLQNGINSYL